MLLFCCLIGHPSGVVNSSFGGKSKHKQELQLSSQEGLPLILHRLKSNPLIVRRPGEKSKGQATLALALTKVAAHLKEASLPVS